MRVAGRAIVVAAIALGALSPSAVANASTGHGPHYVALGDSFAAGSGNFPVTGTPICFRSAVGYPALVARALQTATYTNATCSGATLGNLTNKQWGSVPAQFDALTPETTLVTMTMGDNDIGLTNNAYTCIEPVPDLLGAPCIDRFAAGGHDVLAAGMGALTSTFGAALDQIHARARRAKVVVVGYPTLSRPGGCPQQPIRPRDADYLQGAFMKLDALLQRAAQDHGAVFVDTAKPSNGHDMCAPVDEQWVNGAAAPDGSWALLHPNNSGEANFARLVVDALR